MKYFSRKDIERNHPFYLDLETVKLPLFTSFYAWWNDLSIPKLSTLSTDAAVAWSIEDLTELFYEAKKEVPLLEKPQTFFPDWSIFSSLNAWFDDILSEQLTSIKKIINSTINHIAHQNYQVEPQKLKNINSKFKQIDDCLGLHQREIKKQPVLPKPKEPYIEVNKKFKKSEYSLARLRQHRVFVCRTEEPRGEPYLINNRLHYGPPTREQQRSFQARLNPIDTDIDREQAEYSKLSKTLRNKFFVAQIDENPEIFQKSQQKRTDQALELIRNRM